MWEVGNGSSIRIWDTKWLPKPSTIRIQTPMNTLDSTALVKSLTDPHTKSQNRQLIFQVFSSEEVEIICKIPLSVYGAGDRIYWWLAKNGLLYVKYAYFLQRKKKLRYEGESSTTNRDEGLWTTIWKLRILVLAKHFFQKTCRDILSTRMNLWKRKILNLPKCLICNQESETTLQVLWNCPTACDVQNKMDSPLKK